MRSCEEINKAVDTIYSNDKLTYSYREDVIAVLNWCLGSDEFDGLCLTKECKERREEDIVR